MKHRIFRFLISAALVLSVLLSLTAGAMAKTAVSPQYTQEIISSPDGTHQVCLEYRTNEDGTVCHSFYIINTQSGKITSRVIGQQIVGRIGVYWSPDGSYAAIDTIDDPSFGQSLTILAAKNTRVWRVVDVGTDYNWIRSHDKGLALPPVEEITLPVWKFEKWYGNTRFSIITEYELDGKRIWSRRTLDAASSQLTQVWGDSRDVYDPKNPIWSRAEAIGANIYNSPMHIQSPDLTYRIEVRTAFLRNHPQTWNYLYERMVIHHGVNVYGVYDLDTFHAGWTADMLYSDRPFWNTLCLKFSPDSRYLIAESTDAGAYPFYIDLETGAAAVLPPVWENRDAFAAGEMTASVEAFSVFGEAAVILIGRDGSRQRVIFDMASGKTDKSMTLTGDASDEALSYTAFPETKKLHDAFRGFTAISKTHSYGLDGLFRVGKEYWYVHMGQDFETEMTPAKEYVSDIKAIDRIFDSYRVLYSREGCWVLDENDRAVYAGTGNIRLCGAFALATNLHSKNPIDAEVTRKRLFDSSFRMVLDRVIDTAVQKDGSVYASHTVGRGEFTWVHLSHVHADGTVTDLGRYTGNLSEYRT